MIKVAPMDKRFFTGWVSWLGPLMPYVTHSEGEIGQMVADGRLLLMQVRENWKTVGLVLYYIDPALGSLCIYGLSAKLPPGGLEEGFDALSKLAADWGLVGVEFRVGRPGWHRLARRLGFKPTQYRLEVSDGRHSRREAANTNH